MLVVGLAGVFWPHGASVVTGLVRPAWAVASPASLQSSLEGAAREPEQQAAKAQIQVGPQQKLPGRQSVVLNRRVATFLLQKCRW